MDQPVPERRMTDRLRDAWGRMRQGRREQPLQEQHPQDQPPLQDWGRDEEPRAQRKPRLREQPGMLG